MYYPCISLKKLRKTKRKKSSARIGGEILKRGFRNKKEEN
jgi:uncharacterized protein YdaT